MRPIIRWCMPLKCQGDSVIYRVTLNGQAPKQTLGPLLQVSRHPPQLNPKRYFHPMLSSLLSEQIELNGILPGKPEWASMLSYVLNLHQRSTHLPRPPFQYPWEEIGPGYISSPAFGHWDVVHQILDVLPLAPEHAHHQVLNNLICQHADGFLPGTIWMKSGEAKWSQGAGHPPVWPVAVDALTEIMDSTELLESCYQPLLKQIGWFERERAAETIGFYYLDIVEQIYWESGVDEGVRFDDVLPGKFACIDATSHVYQLYVTAGLWAERLGDDPTPWRVKAAALADFIQQELFDPTTGWYYDIWSMREPERRRIVLEGMWPLVVGAATPAQAEDVIASLLDPDRFFTLHPLATVALCEPAFELRMWRGPVWNSMTYWAAIGCMRYQRADAANRLLEAALDASAVQFERTGNIWEFYHPFGGPPEELARKPDTEFNTPFTDYLGHNPLLAMARLFELSLTR